MVYLQLLQSVWEHPSPANLAQVRCMVQMAQVVGTECYEASWTWELMWIDPQRCLHHHQKVNPVWAQLLVVVVGHMNHAPSLPFSLHAS